MSLTRLRHHGRQSFLQSGQLSPSIGLFEEVDVFLGKVQVASTSIRNWIRSSRAKNSPCKVRKAERAASRLPASIRSAIVFRLREIQLVVEKCASARLRETRAQFQATLHNQLQNLRPAMSLQLKDMLAGKRVGGGKIQRNSIIQRGAVLILERHMTGMPCRQRSADQSIEKWRQIRPGKFVPRRFHHDLPLSLLQQCYRCGS